MRHSSCMINITIREECLLVIYLNKRWKTNWGFIYLQSTKIERKKETYNIFETVFNRISISFIRKFHTSILQSIRSPIFNCCYSNNNKSFSFSVSIVNWIFVIVCYLKTRCLIIRNILFYYVLNTSKYIKQLND